MSVLCAEKLCSMELAEVQGVLHENMVSTLFTNPNVDEEYEDKFCIYNDMT